MVRCFCVVSCVNSCAGTSLMEEVFINEEARPYILEADGTLDLGALRLQPSSIAINGSVTVCTPSYKRTNSSGRLTLTCGTFHAAAWAWLICRPAKLRGHLQKVMRDASAGSRKNPLHVSGELLAGKMFLYCCSSVRQHMQVSCHHWICCRLQRILICT